MAGHSQYANIKHRKGAQDAKKAKKFAKLRRELVVAARSGIPDPEFNPRLRSALANARKQGLPKDKIEAAFKSASNKTDADDYQEIHYMASGSAEMWPNGTSIVIDALTNNKNRTASEVRHILAKFGFVFAELSFMFDRLGLFSYTESLDIDRLMEFALEVGAMDVKKENNKHNVYSSKEGFSRIADALSKKFGDCEYSGLVWVVKSPQVVSKEVSQNLEKVFEALEENDDVQNVYSSVTTEN